MTFKVESRDGKIEGDISVCMEHMRKIGAMQALESHETGLDLAMIRLSNGESLSLDDEEDNEIKVTRIA